MHVCVCESEWVCGYFFVCVLCVQIQPGACAYASCWQINPGNPDLRRQSEEVRLKIYTHTGLFLSHTHTHTSTRVCAVGCNSMCERDRKTATDKEGEKEREKEE